MLNYLWSGFFLLGALVALVRALGGDDSIFGLLVQSTFDSAKLSAEIALGLVGVLALWSGFFRIAEQAGLVNALGRLLNPLFQRLMPEVPKGHPAQGAVTLNLAANILGLDNAATPLGLKAMQALQTLNPSRDTASNAQILFLVLNTSSVTLLPVTLFMYRAQLGAANPADVFIPILLATLASTLAGLGAVMLVQKIPFDRVILGWLAGLVAILGSFMYWMSVCIPGQLTQFSGLMANGLLVLVICGFIAAGVVRKVPVYEQFIEGAKEGFDTAVRLIPYLVAMLVAIGFFRAAGALDLLAQGIKYLVLAAGLDAQFVDALPVALMKPFSGSGARAMMLDVMQHHGVDSFAGKLAAVMQGSTETTFYVLTVYFGVVGITRIRHALWCGLLADVVGLSTAVIVSYLFFNP